MAIRTSSGGVNPLPAIDQILTFTENKGQLTDLKGNLRPDILFCSMQKGMNIYIKNNSIIYLFQERVGSKLLPMGQNSLTENNTGQLHTYRIEMKLSGSNPNALVEVEGEQAGVTNFYLPHCPQGILGVKSYNKITIKEVYPGIDWVVYVKDQKAIEYDFVVRPGANIDNIKIKYDGAIDLKIAEDGSLKIKSPLGEVSESAPNSFTQDGVSIKSGFNLNTNILSFEIEKYNLNQSLTIDPTIVWQLDYGDSGTDATSCKVDLSGNFYLAGNTASSTGIASGGFDNTFNGGYDAFVAKFNSAGTRIWGTYYGGGGDEFVKGIAIDPSNNVLICGSTTSDAGIASGGWDNVFGSGTTDGFIVKFNTSGARIWATYYGGTNGDEIADITTNASGDIYFAGTTGSTASISTPGSFQPVRSELLDGFLVKFNSAGSRIWGTYYGGNEIDVCYSIAEDTDGNVFIGGSTRSGNGIASPGAWDTSYDGDTDGFLAKFNPSGGRVWGTYYGGTEVDYFNDIAIDNNNNLVGVGATASTNNIASGGFDNSNGGGYDAFVVKLTNNGTRIWGTYFGGVGFDQGYAIACDINNNIYAGGYAQSNGLSFQGFQNTNNGGDAFLVKFNSGGSRIWSSYYGIDNVTEYLADISCSSSDILYFCGFTEIEIGLNDENNNSRVQYGSGFFAKIDICNLAPTNINATICFGITYNFNGQLLTLSGNYSTSYVAFSGCDSLVNLTLNVINVIVTTSSTPARCDHPTGTATAMGSGGGPPYSYQWSNGGLTGTISNLVSGSYTVTVTDINNCKKIETVVVQNIIGISTINLNFTPTTCGLNNGTASAIGIGGTAPLEYSWSNFSNNSNLVDLPGGPYSVTITDDNECTYDTSFFIAFSLELTSNFDTLSPLCGQNNGAISINVQNGIGPYIFELIGPVHIVSNSLDENNYTFDNLPAGNYFYRVTDSIGCIVENIVTLINDSGLSGTSSSLPVICNVNGSITVNIQGGSPPYIYSIDGPVQATSLPINDLTFTFNAIPQGNYQVIVLDVNQCLFLSNIGVSFENNLSSNEIIVPTHCGKAAGSIEISVTTGHSPYTYSIIGPVQMSSPITPMNTFVFNNLLPGNYTYNIIDGSGCIIIKDFIIENLPGVNLNSEFVQSDCGQLNGSITLTALQGIPPYVFTLSGQAAQTSGSVNNSIFTFSGLGAGSYSASVSDMTGCLSALEIIITDKNGVSGVTNVTGSNCNSPDGVLNVKAVGGIAPFVYELSGVTTASSGSIQENNYIFSGLLSGIYEIKITDSMGCIYIEMDTILSLNTLLITATASPSECVSATGAILIESNGGSLPIVYELLGATIISSGTVNSTSFNFEKLLAGPYDIKVTDSKGCVAELQVNVENQSGFKSEMTVISTRCGDSNGKITLASIDGMAPFSYSITGPVTSSINGIQNTLFTFENLPAGEYTYNIVDGQNCNIMGLATVNNSTRISFEASLSGFSCGGGNGTITINNVVGSRPFSYKLNDGQATMDSVFLGLISNTNYLLEVSDANGCRRDSTILTTADISFKAVTDTVYFDYYSNPVIFNVIENDELNGINNFEVNPVNKQVFNSKLEPIGTIINALGVSGEFEFYYHGNYNSITKKYELFYPMDKELIYYLLCTEECPGACDTGTIVLLSKYECIDNNKDYVNTFTPNGDGQNDVLVLPQFPECSVQASEFKVFNRWGKAVFNSKNYANNWDGKNDQGTDLPEGTYYYVLQLKTKNGKTHVIKNFVELIR